MLPIKIFRGNNAVFVSVDLIGEKNQVILELSFIAFKIYKYEMYNRVKNVRETEFGLREYMKNILIYIIVH